MHLRDAFVDLLLGGRCAGCGRPGRRLCPACRVIVVSGRPAVHRPDPEPGQMPATMVTGSYDGLWPSVLAEFKEHGAWSLAGPLAQRLWPAVASTALASAPGTAIAHVLVPMPSRSAVVRERGNDTTVLLARRVTRIARGSGWHLPTVRALRVARPVVDSAGLGARDRMANLSGALAMRAGVAARLRGSDIAVVLCDDLVTTGASLTEAARALRAEGVTVAGAVALVATRRRHRGDGPRG